MRGTTTLILHSLDPESLEKVEDLHSLDPESDDDDPYKNMEANNRYQIPTLPTHHQPSESNTSEKYLGHSSPSETNQFPGFGPFRPESSPSPPLIKSHYQDDHDDSDAKDNHSIGSSHSQNQLEDVMTRLFRSYGQASAASLNAKTFTSLGSGLPLSRVKSCRNEISSCDRLPNNKAREDEATSQRGLSRFLHSIGLMDRQNNKADKNRFNINNLPPQMKEELKHIYVY